MLFHVSFFTLMTGLVTLMVIIPVIGLSGWVIPSELISTGFYLVIGGVSAGLLNFMIEG